MKYIKRFDENIDEFESEKKGYDFYNSEYIPEDKSIIGAYYITKQSEKSIEVLNLQEKYSTTGVYMDNSTPYTIGGIARVILPISQITIISPVESREGFFYIKIPYWLYKKTPEMVIYRRGIKKRFDGGKTIEPLISSVTKEYKKDYLTKMLLPDVEGYLLSSNDDNLFTVNFTNFKRSAKRLLDNQ